MPITRGAARGVTKAPGADAPGLDDYSNQAQSQTQPMTQEVFDPRRTGRNNSGLEEVDIADVLCILHPCSPAAFRIVQYTAVHSPQHVLQDVSASTYDDGLEIEEAETFIMDGADRPREALDLALRFSARRINPSMGFVFGRNRALCDIVIGIDTVKRVSNTHFSIFVNSSGVCMLNDMSTNGTVVDGHILKGRSDPQDSTRMLNAGSIIEILSPKPEERVKFILRIPSRDDHMEEFIERFGSYMREVAKAQALEGGLVDRRGNKAAYPRLAATGNLPMVRPPVVRDHYGMHWNGGEQYNVVGHLGKGAFATVYRLATKREGQLFAAKELEKRRFMKNGILDRKLENELQIMRSISHPHVVQYVDYKDIHNHLYIIMEYVPCGDMQQFLKNGPLPEEAGKIVAAQVLDALDYLHHKMITHRDIKPDNILIADDSPENFTVKLSDFGLSKVVTDNETFLKTFCGTLLYCAPEVFPHYEKHMATKGRKRPRTAQRQKHHYSQAVDIWSLGAVLWFALCRRPPFEGIADATGQGMFDRIISTTLDPRPLREYGVDEEGIRLMMDMLNTDPAARPTPSKCLRYPWFEGDEEEEAEGQDQDEGLADIEEEEEAEDGAAPDFSQLSIKDKENGYSSSQGSSDGSTDPRQSKRFKVAPTRLRTQANSQPVQQGRAPAPTSHPRNAQTQPPPLFGEIPQSLLASSGVFGRGNGLMQAHATEWPPADSSLNISLSRHKSMFASMAGADSCELSKASTGDKENIESPSLDSAESHMRDLKMDSAETADSPPGEPNEPQTPRTPSVAGSTGSQHDSTTEETPRADGAQATPKEKPKYNRQIELPLSASFFYDPADPSTHNPEYASSVSGFDFTSNGLLPSASFHSLPPRLHASALDPSTSFFTNPPASPPPAPQSQPEFIRPATRLGRLTSTPDSFTSIDLPLSTRVTTWGRYTSNTFVYPDPNDIRIPKLGFVLYFHANGIEKTERNNGGAVDAWLRLDGLHCLLRTETRLGVRVNGVRLEPNDKDGAVLFGHVYSGDEITVSEGKGGVLKFRCEFLYGEGKAARPEGAPRFVVQRLGARKVPGK